MVQELVYGPHVAHVTGGQPDHRRAPQKIGQNMDLCGLAAA